MDGILDVDAIETPEDITEPIEPQEDAVNDEPSGDPNPEPTDKVDGRKFNPEWSRQLKELRELYANDPEKGPKIADMLTKMRDNYARGNEYLQIAPKGLDDIRSWKTTMDALGGPEQAAALMERAATMDSIDERIAAGDYGVIGELPEELQAGFNQMLAPALDGIAESDPQAYAAVVAPHLQRALAGTGLGDYFKQLEAAAGDNEQLRQLAQQGANWFKQQTQNGATVPTNGQRSVDPQVRQLQDRLAKYESGEQDNFVKSVTDSTEKHLTDSFARDAGVYIKQLGLSKEQQDDLMQSFNQKLTQKLGADAGFQAQLKAFRAMKNRSPESVTNYVRSKIDEHAKATLDGLVTTRYGSRRTAAAPTPATTTVAGGPMAVAQPPDQSQWDMDKMTALGYEATVKQGVYHLTGGRTVQVKRA